MEKNVLGHVRVVDPDAVPPLHTGIFAPHSLTNAVLSLQRGG